MDGHTVQKMRLLTKENAEIKTQNTFLSAEALRMAQQIDGAAKGTSLDRLLIAALLAHLAPSRPSGEVFVEVPTDVVDTVRAEMSSAPGLSYTLAKDEEHGVWRVALQANAVAEDTPAPPVIHGSPSPIIEIVQ